MSWNNRKETRIFEAEQKKLQQYYLDSWGKYEEILSPARDSGNCLIG